MGQFTSFGTNKYWIPFTYRVTCCHLLWCCKWTTMCNERLCPHIHKKFVRDGVCNERLCTHIDGCTCGCDSNATTIRFNVLVLEIHFLSIFGKILRQNKRFNHVLDQNFSNNDHIWTIFCYFLQETTFPMSDDTGIFGLFFENLASNDRRSFATPE